MKATPWPEGCATAPLLKPGQNSLSSSHFTIHDVPTTSLANQTELALIVLMDRSKREILLQVPGTKLNWRFHFGCPAVLLENGEIDTANIATELQRHSIQVPPRDIRKAGTMLFSFPVQDPLRVHVLEAAVDASQAVGGTWTSWDDIPYSDMWADDILWLPWFVTEQRDRGVTFEGHFVFDGEPGPISQLVAHNCQRTDR